MTKSVLIAVISLLLIAFAFCAKRPPQFQKTGSSIEEIQSHETKSDLSEVNAHSLDSIRLFNVLNRNTVVESDSNKTITGYFVGIEVGDYQHLLLRVDNDTITFWGTGDIDEDSVKEGDKIKVQWKRERQFIPESGDTLNLEIAEKAIRIMG